MSDGATPLMEGATFGAAGRAPSGIYSYEPPVPSTKKRKKKQAHHELNEREKKLMATFEGLDYEITESELYRERQMSLTPRERWRITFAEWTITFLIGFCTGFTAFLINLCVENLFRLKFYLTLELLHEGKIWGAFAVFAVISISFVTIATILVAFIEPVACGSGIPQMKGYLNGANLKNAVRLKTLIVKAVGVTFSVSGGLPIGKEGPMVHVGSCYAALLSHLPKLPNFLGRNALKHFRTDQYKRDFISGGCAAGVAAAFGAPIGGVLFALEEAASYWSLSVTWRSFFCAMVSTFTLNVFMTGITLGKWDNVDSPGLLDFGNFKADAYKLYEMPVFAIIGVLGGLLGAAFCAVNTKVSHMRIACINSKPIYRAIEAVMVATVVSTCCFWMPYAFSDKCLPIPDIALDPINPVTGVRAVDLYKRNYYKYIPFTCPNGTYNQMATIIFTTQEDGIHALFHDDAARSDDARHYIPTFEPTVLLTYGCMYFFLAVYTYGLAVPSGLFVPSILTGSALARIIGAYLSEHDVLGLGLFGTSDIQPGLYAFMGAAAMLGGVTRMTISLVIILVETTNDVQYLMPVMMTVMISKWVGDLFNISLYDIHVELLCIPFVESTPPQRHTLMTAADVMVSPVVAFRTTEKVGVVYDTLNNITHNGFPVINDANELVGMSLRSHLTVMLQKRAFMGNKVEQDLVIEDFGTSLSSFCEPLPDALTNEDRMQKLDLMKIMNPAPFSVQEDCPVSRVYRLFRSMGMRHLVVVGTHNELRGIITRKNLRTDFSGDLN